MKLKAFDITKVKVGDKAYTKQEIEHTIICIDNPGNNPIVTHENNGEVSTYSKEGFYRENSVPSPFDLMLPVTTKTYYMAVWNKDNKMDNSKLYETEDIANYMGKPVNIPSQIIKVEIGD